MVNLITQYPQNEVELDLCQVLNIIKELCLPYYGEVEFISPVF